MLTFEELNAIGDILNTSWGKHSTDRGSYPVGSAPPGSLTGHLVPTAGPALDLPLDVVKRQRLDGGLSPSDVECNLVINYVDVVSFRSDQEIQANVRVFRQVAEARCATKVKEMKAEFRDVIGRALKVKLKEGHDSVEALYTPTPEISLVAKPHIKPQLFRGYYRYTAIYSIS